MIKFFSGKYHYFAGLFNSKNLLPDHPIFVFNAHFKQALTCTLSCLRSFRKSMEEERIFFSNIECDVYFDDQSPLFFIDFLIQRKFHITRLSGPFILLSQKRHVLEGGILFAKNKCAHICERIGLVLFMLNHL
jgi:hypothetical protein